MEEPVNTVIRPRQQIFLPDLRVPSALPRCPGQRRRAGLGETAPPWRLKASWRIGDRQVQRAKYGVSKRATLRFDACT